MSLWHIILTRGERLLMEEIQNCVDALTKVAYRHREVVDAIEICVEANRKAQAAGVQFEQALKAIQPIIDANPNVKAMEIGFDRVLIRHNNGTCEVKQLTPLYALHEPAPEPPLIPASEASLVFERIDPSAHVRIQNGQATEADRDMMAAAHAYAQTFGDPDVEGEE